MFIKCVWELVNILSVSLQIPCSRTVSDPLKFATRTRGERKSSFPSLLRGRLRKKRRRTTTDAEDDDGEDIEVDPRLSRSLEELPCDIKEHILKCRCSCDHLGYGNYSVRYTTFLIHTAVFVEALNDLSKTLSIIIIFFKLMT